jgi:hypothetical protein
MTHGYRKVLVRQTDSFGKSKRPGGPLEAFSTLSLRVARQSKLFKYITHESHMSIAASSSLKKAADAGLDDAAPGAAMQAVAQEARNMLLSRVSALKERQDLCVFLDTCTVEQCLRVGALLRLTRMLVVLVNACFHGQLAWKSSSCA